MLENYGLSVGCLPADNLGFFEAFAQTNMACMSSEGSPATAAAASVTAATLISGLTCEFSEHCRDYVPGNSGTSGESRCLLRRTGFGKHTAKNVISSWAPAAQPHTIIDGENKC